MYEYAFCLEHIHSQHHYSGAKLKFLQKYCIGRVSNCYILSNICGSIFLQLATNKIDLQAADNAAKKSICPEIG